MVSLCGSVIDSGAVVLPFRTSPKGLRKNNLAECPTGSDQCSIPNAQFSAEVDVGLRVVRSVRIRIEHWELTIGQILGLMSSSEYGQVIFARALSRGSSSLSFCLP